MVRYLRTCEHYAPNVTHLNIQLLSYPWFQNQVHFFPRVQFPPILPNVSTHRNQVGNTNLIVRFLKANLKKGVFQKGGIYLDMQAINDAEITNVGQYHGVTLLPVGLVYRVLPPLRDVEHVLPKWYKRSLNQLKHDRSILLPYVPMNNTNSLSLTQQLSPKKGSWEYACISLFWDMHYQLGLHMLSYALTIDKSMKTKPTLFITYVSTLRRSSQLLWKAYSANEQHGTLRYAYVSIEKIFFGYYFSNMDFFLTNCIFYLKLCMIWCGD